LSASASDTASFIKESVDIVDVIGQAVPLRRSGNRHVGLCPFHEEKTPSFQVDAEKQLFYCFGCHTGGDVLKFVMKHRNLSFGEAAQYLADRYGLALPRGDSPPSPSRGGSPSEKERLFHVLKLAADYYYGQLHHGSAGAVAREYLARRGLPPEVVERQRLGYAPAGWDNLLSHLRKARVDPATAQKAGLVVLNAKGRCYDRFRHRLVFPIADDARRVAAFGGRSLDGSEPKYLNSPETPVYHKGSMLYELATARQACRRVRQVVLVEGYMDLLAFHAAGFQRVTATLGTALTPRQVRLLARTCDEAVLVYDGDEAGRRAMIRSLPLFLKERLSASCLVLPDGMDPDDFLRSRGLDDFLSLLEERRDLGLYAIEKTIEGWDGTVGGKSRVLKDLKPVLSASDRTVLRSEYVPLVCERLGLSESSMTRHLHFMERSGSSPAPASVGRSPSGWTPQTRSLEERVTGILIHYPKLGELVRESGGVRRFRQAALASIADVLLDGEKSFGKDPGGGSAYENLGRPELREIYARLAMEEDPYGDEETARLHLEHDLRALEEREERALPGNLRQALELAQQKGDGDLVRRILERMKELCSARKGVKGEN